MAMLRHLGGALVLLFWAALADGANAPSGRSSDACAAGAADAACEAEGDEEVLLALRASVARHQRGGALGSGAKFEGQIQWTIHPSLCVDVREGLPKNGTRLQLWECFPNSPNQQFLWNSFDRKLRWAAHPELCVDIYNHLDYDGNHVLLWECHEGNEGQRFELDMRSSGGPLKIRWSLHSTKCLDVYDNFIQIWTCLDWNGDQYFSFAQGGSSTTGSPTSTSGGDQAVPYDVIVVGGGLVGSVIAAELAERLPGQRVLLVEAGKAGQAVMGGSEPPGQWNSNTRRWDTFKGLEHSGLTKYDVPGNYGTLQCWDRQCSESWGDDVPAFQCKVLGGCGVVNGALMQLPHDAMFDTWPIGWQASDMSPYFEAAEGIFDITHAPSRNGVHYLTKSGADFVQSAFGQNGGLRYAKTVLKPKANQMGKPEVTAKDGIRQSTTSQLLPRALQNSNFELMLETEVVKIVQSGGKASGLLVNRKGRGQEEIRLSPKGLVVVSAGAMNTPRLLLASGVTGNGYVGKGVSDHALLMLIYTISETAGRSDPDALSGASESWTASPPSSRDIQQYLTFRSGPLAQFGPSLVAFLRHPSTTGPSDIWDIEIWVSPQAKAREAHVSLVLMRPTCSSGTLFLGSDGKLELSGELKAPCSRDEDILLWGVKMIDRWLGESGATRISPSDESLVNSKLNMNHFVGSCALGTCVSPADLRVRGTENIAVADASIVPKQIWGHPSLTLAAVGFKSAAVLTASLM